MKLGKGKKVIFIEHQATFDNAKEFERLRELGREKIQKDDAALINYAVVYALKETIRKHKEDEQKNKKARKGRKDKRETERWVKDHI